MIFNYSYKKLYFVLALLIAAPTICQEIPEVTLQTKSPKRIISHMAQKRAIKTRDIIQGGIIGSFLFGSSYFVKDPNLKIALRVLAFAPMVVGFFMPKKFYQKFDKLDLELDEAACSSTNYICKGICADCRITKSYLAAIPLTLIPYMIYSFFGKKHLAVNQPQEQAVQEQAPINANQPQENAAQNPVPHDNDAKQIQQNEIPANQENPNMQPNNVNSNPMDEIVQEIELTDLQNQYKPVDEIRDLADNNPSELLSSQDMQARPAKETTEVEIIEAQQEEINAAQNEQQPMAPIIEEPQESSARAVNVAPQPEETISMIDRIQNRLVDKFLGTDEEPENNVSDVQDAAEAPAEQETLTGWLLSKLIGF